MYKMSRVHNLIRIVGRLVGIILLRGSCFRFDYAVNRLVGFYVQVIPDVTRHVIRC